MATIKKELINELGSSTVHQEASEKVILYIRRMQASEKVKEIKNFLGLFHKVRLKLRNVEGTVCRNVNMNVRQMIKGNVSYTPS